MAKEIIGCNSSYTKLPNKCLWDKSLSAKAKGVYAFLMAVPDDWKFSTAGLTVYFSDGVKSIETALQELESAGYLIRIKGRTANGTYAEMTYILYSYPHHSADDQKPDTENPHMTRPDIGSPQTENRPQSINTDTDNTKTNDKLSKKHTPSKTTTHPTLEEVKTFCIAESLNIEAEKFYFYYEAQGWRTGNAPIVDWQAKARTWDLTGKKDLSKSSRNKFFNFSERTDTDYDAIQKAAALELAHPELK